MRDVVKFNGRPVEVTLVYPKGKPGNNDRGDFFTYTAEGDRIFFATPALDMAIQETDPGRGARLRIARYGEDKWDVKRLDQPPQEQPRIAPPAAPVADLQTTQQGNGTAKPVTAPAWLMTGQGQRQLQYFTEAIDLAIAAEKYAMAAGGKDLRCTFEDVRCIATSLRIGAEQGGR